MRRVVPPAGNVIALVVCLALVSFATTAAADSDIDFTVTGFEPAPNYAPTRSEPELEMRQLSDGETGSGRIWTSERSVGWLFRTPVTIALQTEAEGVGGLLDIALHVADAVPVLAPVRLSVYGVTATGIRYLGAATLPPAPAGSPAHRWVTARAIPAARTLKLVVHSGHRVLVVDEISISRSNSDAAPTDTEAVSGAVAEDSGRRWGRALMTRHLDHERERMNAMSTKPLVVVAPAFGRLDLSAFRDAMAAKVVAPAADGVAWFALALMNPGAEPLRGRLHLAGPENVSFDLFRVEPVAAFPDTVAFDPLVPKTAKELAVDGGEVGRYLVRATVDGSEGLQRHAVTVTFEHAGESLTSELEIRAGPALDPQPPLRKVVWAYDTNQPIWRSRAANMKLLAESGVNVNVVHPRLVPGEVAKSWDSVEAERLRRRLSTYPDGTIHLFFLAWKDAYLDASSVDQATAWITRFGAWVEQAEKNGTWVAYLVDEPRRDKAERLIRSASVFRRHAPSLPLYANPLAAISLDQLRRLKPLIEYWQPEIDALLKYHEFFAGVSEDRLWYFSNPRYGSKRTAAAFFRSRAWLAAGLDVSGIGFWAYDDTQGSSAWDDFDGVRPDWAVVYEGPRRVVSSRRWEAFVQGTREYPQLRALRDRCADIAGIVTDFAETPTARDMAAMERMLVTDQCSADVGLPRDR